MFCLVINRKPGFALCVGFTFLGDVRLLPLIMTASTMMLMSVTAAQTGTHGYSDSFSLSLSLTHTFLHTLMNNKNLKHLFYTAGKYAHFYPLARW